MNATMLRPDCTRCASLCCVALTFERSQLFAIDKAAGIPCQNLEGNGRCRIHTQREHLGFGGCVSYDCFGAGQRVIQELFGGRSWLDDSSLLPSMSRAFEDMRRIHELLLLLHQARKLPLPAEEFQKIRAFETELHFIAGSAGEALAAKKITAMETDVRCFLRKLAAYVANKRNDGNAAPPVFAQAD